MLAIFVGFNLTAGIDNGLYDFAMRAHAQRVDPRILLVTIDDRSLAELGPWPWPRDRYARILDALHAGGARAVALDVLLVQPGDTAGDAALAKALGSDGPVYLPVAFAVPGPDGAPFALTRPLPAFAAAAAGLGQINLAPDADGTVRRSFLTYRHGRETWPHLVGLIASAPSPEPQPDSGGRAQGGAALSATNPAMISFAGPQGTIPAVSAASVLRGEVPGDLLRGRLVLVGAAASGLGDAYATPVGADGSLMPGIEVQANLLNSLLTGTVINPVARLPLYFASLLPQLLLLLALRRLRPRLTLPAIVLLLAATLGGAIALLGYGHVWLPPGAALVGVLLLYPFWTWRRLVMVSSYMSRELAQLDAERGPLERPLPNLADTDFVGRQMGLLRAGIGRERDLRAFLVQRIAQMPDAVLVTDRAGTVLLANARARALYARLSGCAGESQAPAPTNAGELLALLESDTPQPSGPGDFGAIADAGEPCGGPAHTVGGRSFDIRYEPQRSATGEPVGLIIRIADTTEATLMQRQREDVLELLSHDMRSPQASILALLDRPDAQVLPADLAARLRGFALRTLGLADDFIHLSRAELIPISPELVDLPAVVQDAVDALWPQAQARGVRLSCQLPDAMLLTLGDPSLLTRALINLIDNALKFSPAKTSVTVELVETTADDGDRKAEIRVRDEGPGIAPDQLGAIFERFTRAPGGATRKIGGSGLGLALVHTVAVRHHGRVSCASELGHGACFTLELPLTDEILDEDESL